jgi:hypothetical protein
MQYIAAGLFVLCVLKLIVRLIVGKKKQKLDTTARWRYR